MAARVTRPQEAVREVATIACQRDVGAFGLEQRRRYERLLDAVLGNVLEVRELPNGYALRYPSDAPTIVTIAEWVTMERLCCPFLDFELHVEPESGPLWLKLSGGAGVKALLEAEIAGRDKETC